MSEVTTPPPLNAGQQEAADAFFDFLVSDAKHFIISGPGGVGKTFLMGHLIDNVIPRYQDTCNILGIKCKYDNVVMCATTNKAAEVLSIATNRPCETVHKYMNLTIKENFSTGQVQLIRTKTWQPKYNTVIFVDEASMIDSPLLKEINEGTIHCKIVFVGDHCQLPPVKEALSPVFKKATDFYNLTEPMRNSGQPALVNICTQLRATVETGEFQPIKIVPGVIDHITDLSVLAKEIDSYFLQQTVGSRILAYTNDAVVEYNNYIRGLRGLNEHIVVGEILVNNNAVRHSDGSMISVEEELEVLRIGDSEMIAIDEETDLEVRRCDLVSRYATYLGVPVPVDRQYHQDLIKYFVSKKEWQKKFHLQGTYPDLRPRDAATIHKAQGSSYDTVFIDLDNLSRMCRRPDLVARLLYVGFTRARNRIVLYGELAEKYGGLYYG